MAFLPSQLQDNHFKKTWLKDMTDDYKYYPIL